MNELVQTTLMRRERPKCLGCGRRTNLLNLWELCPPCFAGKPPYRFSRLADEVHVSW